MANKNALETRKITKRYPGVVANDQVDFTLRKGTIHALLGENGAGKSTLMNVIYGLADPDEGDILIDGKVVTIQSPKDAIAHGIGMVHQHFMLVPVFTVAENIVLGDETVKGTTLDMKSAETAIAELSQANNLPIDPKAIVENLPVGTQQRVEIVKALYRNATVLVLDEPTAVLTPQEADDLFVVMRQLTARGVSIIFITHKLREVMEVADDITVMRRGKVVGSTTPTETSEQGLAAMMVGRDVVFSVEKDVADPGETVLKVNDLSAHDERDIEVVEGVSFEVRAGEVLGIAGVQGNGQTELAEVLTGLRNPSSGSVLLEGKEITYGDPRNLYESGLAHVPEDRQRHGLVMTYGIDDDLVLNTYYKPPFAGKMTRRFNAIADNAVKLVEKFDVRTPSAFAAASTLSGGNQQKVIIARELNRPIKLLLVNQPTRGLDVGSIEFIHQQIIAQRDSGTAVIVISAELDEILSLSDRIAVMFDGKMVAILDAADATREQLGLLMAGSGTSESQTA